jgi:opacity protein-like surface antigen
MKIRTWLVPTIVLMGIGMNSVAADPLDYSKRAYYIGGDLSLYNSTEIEINRLSVKETSDLGDFGFNFIAGYEFDTSKLVKLGLEAEYRQFGEVDDSDSFQIKGNGLFLNVKPKFIVQYDHADVYVSLLAGLGSIDVKTTVNNVSASKSELAFQYGAELGYILNRDIDIHVGYRSAIVEIDNYNVSNGSAYAGIRYFF